MSTFKYKISTSSKIPDVMRDRYLPKSSGTVRTNAPTSGPVLATTQQKIATVRNQGSTNQPMSPVSCRPQNVTQPMSSRPVSPKQTSVMPVRPSSTLKASRTPVPAMKKHPPAKSTDQRNVGYVGVDAERCRYISPPTAANAHRGLIVSNQKAVSDPRILASSVVTAHLQGKYVNRGAVMRGNISTDSESLYQSEYTDEHYSSRRRPRASPKIKMNSKTTSQRTASRSPVPSNATTSGLKMNLSPLQMDGGLQTESLSKTTDTTVSGSTTITLSARRTQAPKTQAPLIYPSQPIPHPPPSSAYSSVSSPSSSSVMTVSTPVPSNAMFPQISSANPSKLPNQSPSQAKKMHIKSSSISSPRTVLTPMTPDPSSTTLISSSALPSTSSTRSVVTTWGGSTFFPSTAHSSVSPTTKTKKTIIYTKPGEDGSFANLARLKQLREHPTIAMVNSLKSTASGNVAGSNGRVIKSKLGGLGDLFEPSQARLNAPAQGIDPNSFDGWKDYVHIGTRTPQNTQSTSPKNLVDPKTVLRRQKSEYLHHWYIPNYCYHQVDQFFKSVIGYKKLTRERISILPGEEGELNQMYGTHETNSRKLRKVSNVLGASMAGTKSSTRD